MSGRAEATETPGYTPSEKLRGDHEYADFDSGEPALDDWLRRRALANETGEFSRTYVVCEPGTRRVGAYYSLASGGADRGDAPGRVRRNAPDPIPVLILGRLAVDASRHGHGLGARLVRDAVLKALIVADVAGVRALMVDALSDRVVPFYERLGFHPSPTVPRTLFLPLGEAELILGGDRPG